MEKKYCANYGMSFKCKVYYENGYLLPISLIKNRFLSDTPLVNLAKQTISIKPRKRGIGWDVYNVYPNL